MEEANHYIHQWLQFSSQYIGKHTGILKNIYTQVTSLLTRALEGIKSVREKVCAEPEVDNVTCFGHSETQIQIMELLPS